MNILSLESVRVERGRALVLDDVSLSVGRREVVTLLGSNGVGKSTTLRTVSGLHRALAGRITLDGKDVTRKNPATIARLGVAHVPEGRQIFAGLTVRENLEIGARVAGGLSDATLDQVFGLFPDLADGIAKLGGVLSGGQQQMLAIGRGLVARPKLLLLDEPSLGLAPKVVSHIAGIIKQLPELGISVLLVEQNATMALDVADRGYLMTGGTIVSQGTAKSLRSSDDVRAVYLGKIPDHSGDPSTREGHV